MAIDLAKIKRDAVAKMRSKKRMLNKPDKFDKPSIGSKAILALLRAKRKITGAPKRKVVKRTQKITDRLEAAGLSKSEIDRLRGKRK